MEQPKYKRPLRLRPAYINTKGMYNNLFSLYKNSHQKRTFEKLSEGYINNNDQYFMKTALYLTEKNNTNSDFVEELHSVLKANYECIGFAITLHKPSIYHMIGGIIFPKERKLELYDPNAVAQYPLNSKGPSLNNLYDLTFSFFDNILNDKHQYFAHVERAFVPGTCGIFDKGICALWSIIYIMNRMSKTSVQQTHKRIFDIANSKNSKQFMIHLMRKIQRLKNTSSSEDLKEILDIVQTQNV